MSGVYYLTVVLFVGVFLQQVLSASTGARAEDSLSDLGHQKLADILSSSSAPFGYRSGNASRNHSCGRVRSVPFSLRFYWVFKPSGISDFYQKYTESYGIPVIGSRNVSDDALKRACYVLRFLLADHSKIRQSFYKHFGRVTVIGLRENITDIPEYKFLPTDMNDRARGLGPTESVPVASGAEENLQCYREDRYFGEDILLHELAHGVHMAAKYEIPGWQRRLVDSYKRATSSGLWQNTYSSTSVEEYLAEGVQSHFRANCFSDPSNGVHGPVDTPEKLLTYDPDLYHLIELLFPCRNSFTGPCQSNRRLCNQTQPVYAVRDFPGRITLTDAINQMLKLDCDLTQEYHSNLLRSVKGNQQQVNYLTLRPSESGICTDNNNHCQSWSLNGECEANPAYMLAHCKLSCGAC